jgi:hypothetical protein
MLIQKFTLEDFLRLSLLRGSGRRGSSGVPLIRGG